MSKYRARRYEVDAVQYTGRNASDLAQLPGIRFYEIDPIDATDDPDVLGQLWYVNAGWVAVYAGDWIYRDPEGDFRRCTAKEFTAAYEPVEG